VVVWEPGYSKRRHNEYGSLYIRQRDNERQGKKVEFLNVVGLTGTAAAAPGKYCNIYGRSGVYALWLNIARDSGVIDRVLVLFQEDKVEAASFGELPWNEPGGLAALITEGSRVEVTGAVQTFKENTTGRTQLFVWAYRVAAEKEESCKREFNNVYITGEVAKVPRYRETPKGRRITELSLRIPSAFTQGFYSYIPCITWETVADRAQWLEEGTTVYLEGRLQSRDYVKRFKDGTEKLYITWEVSVCRITEEEQTAPEQEQEGEPEVCR